MKRTAKSLYFKAAQLTPKSMKSVLRPIARPLRRIFESKNHDQAGIISPPILERTRPRVLHVIANFMLGGSSRLVMDLVENLPNYEHRVVTSLLPSPPAYEGVNVTEFRSPQSAEDVMGFLHEYGPTIVHVHYWGDCDYWWYDIFFKAVRQMNCRVIENVNTPVSPYLADWVDHYVHVSDYVQNKFGDGGVKNMTIYPGSDFSHFARTGEESLPQDCIGMVYRLENDKLNDRSIDVFIKVAQRRPQTKVLIVGGGTNLEPYRKATQRAGVEGNFEFTGYVDYAKLPALYERMSIFVAPVWKESFGQVSPFAMNMMIPVVGYDVGGLAEIVQNSALLATPENSDELAEIIVELLNDPERCREIGEQNHLRAQAKFSVQAMISSYQSLYANLVEASR